MTPFNEVRIAIACSFSISSSVDVDIFVWYIGEKLVGSRLLICASFCGFDFLNKFKQHYV
jgi:hypothetical protein